MMIIGRRVRVVVQFVLLCGLCSSASLGHVFATSEGEAHEAVGMARSAVVSGYVAVVDAEKAGANVTSLLATLNNASDLLSRADLALGKGDYNASFTFASESQQMLNGFNVEASILKDNAVQKGFSDFMIYVVGSILGTVFVVFGSFAIWVPLKSRYREADSNSDES